MSDSAALARRWRLVLGRYAEQRMPLGPGNERLDETLGYLYDREYRRRGHLGAGEGKGASLDASVVEAVRWLGDARELFPTSTFERVQAEAITRYGLTELLTDPATARRIEPSVGLAAALLQVRERLDEAAAAGLREIIARVVDELVRRLRPRFETALGGSRNLRQRSLRPRAADLDWRRTVRENLGNYDRETQRLMIDRVSFTGRARRTLSWDVVLLVDQSGSMASSLVYSAVCASVLSGLPGIRVRLLTFDTGVVDLTSFAHDPVQVLMAARLGGGTDIAGALAYAESVVTTPARTVVAVVSDFYEGGSVGALLATARRMAAGGTRLIGIAALDDTGVAAYDTALARRLVEVGMDVAAVTPDRFAEWLAEVMA
ncbi:VWA domain-containing protein [Microbacterium sp. P06]|uniref:VWA domain-containing protein n=1 Tax=Microbacterium sp. P06 TaxID=3366949 RepID=UPI003745724B